MNLLQRVHFAGKESFLKNEGQKFGTIMETALMSFAGCDTLLG